MSVEMTLGGVTFSDEAARFDGDTAHHWIAGESYWAAGIPRDVFDKSLAHSLVAGAYETGSGMIAMARVVTDRATFGWICDVFVDKAHRGRGLGKAMMIYLKAHPDLQGFRRLHLATRDAHGLYRQFGFSELSGADRWMEIRDPNAYAR